MLFSVTVAAGSCRFRPTKIQYLKNESSTTGTIATKMWLVSSCAVSNGRLVRTHDSQEPHAHSKARSDIRLALLSLHISGIAALYTSKGPVKPLTHKNFAAEVVDSDLPAIVEFFAPWCGHCKNLAPIYTKVAQNLKVRDVLGPGQTLPNVHADGCTAKRTDACCLHACRGLPQSALWTVTTQPTSHCAASTECRAFQPSR